MSSTNYISKDNPLLDFIVNPRKRIYRHLLLFLFLGILIAFNAINIPKDMDKQILYILAGFYVFCMAVLYVNLYVLIPKLLFKNKYGSYFLSVLLTIVFVFLIVMAFTQLFSLHEYAEAEEVNTQSILSGFFTFFILFGSFIVSSTTIKLFQRWIIDTSHMRELEKNTMDAELEQLKNQITPHFLFNTLNNTNVLIQTEPQKASQTIMMLSDLLRYQLYDSTREKILLLSDIRFLSNFLNLEKIRRDKFEFAIVTEGDISNLLIPPLLFIPFVENAVKHSEGAKNGACIHLKLTLTVNRLDFVCINSKLEKGNESENRGGLGLANVRRRLDLLFGGKYHLDIHEKKDSYRVNLNIIL